MVLTITLFGSAGSGTAKVLGLACDAGIDLAVLGFHGEFKDVTLGKPSYAAISGAGWWVGPMMKFPSSFAAGMAPSGNAFALTYPGVFGSRVGSGGRAPLLALAGACLSGGCCAGVWAIAAPKPAIRQIKNAQVGVSNMQDSFPPILTHTPSNEPGLALVRT